MYVHIVKLFLCLCGVCGDFLIRLCKPRYRNHRFQHHPHLCRVVFLLHLLWKIVNIVTAETGEGLYSFGILIGKILRKHCTERNADHVYFLNLLRLQDFINSSGHLIYAVALFCINGFSVTDNIQC